MRYKRWFRVLVCLVLVCALIVNISPIRAKATVVVSALTLAELTGLLTLMVGTTVGAVYMVNNMDEVSAVGQSVVSSLQNTMDDYLHTDEEWEAYQKYVDGFYNNFFSGDDFDGYDPNSELRHNLARGILAAIAGTLVASVVAGHMEGEVEEEVPVEGIPEGYARYGSVTVLHQLPSDLLSEYPYVMLVQDGSWHYFILTKAPLIVYKYNGMKVSLAASVETTGVRIDTKSSDTELPEPSASSTYTTAMYSSHIPVWTLKWANYDVYTKGPYVSNPDTIFLEGSEPVCSGDTTTEKETITIDPIYVGDLPTKIETGEIDEEEGKEQILAPLPDYIDITKVIKSPETAVDDLTAWQQQVVDGQKSLEQSLKDITAELEDIEDGIEGSATTPSEAPAGPAPSTELGDYTLDLRDIFPFCIPFDIYEFLVLLCAEPEAPKFDFTFNFGKYLGVHTLSVDLSQWDSTAQLLRRLELLLFIVGLAMATRNYYIRG